MLPSSRSHKSGRCSNHAAAAQKAASAVCFSPTRTAIRHVFFTLTVRLFLCKGRIKAKKPYRIAVPDEVYLSLNLPFPRSPCDDITKSSVALPVPVGENDNSFRENGVCLSHQTLFPWAEGTYFNIAWQKMVSARNI